MATETFKASRWTSGNHLFTTVIEVTEAAVIRRKRSWFTVNEISIHLSKVASVRIETGLLWSDITVESTGGSDPLSSHGHTKADARRIKELIEAAQSRGESERRGRGTRRPRRCPNATSSRSPAAADPSARTIRQASTASASAPRAFTPTSRNG